MIATIVLVDLLVAGLLVHRFVRRLQAALAWPTPTPRRYLCGQCPRAYTDSRVLGLHIQAAHPDVYDDGFTLGR